MAAGYQVSLLDINNRAGALVVGLWSGLEEIRKFKLWLDDSAHNDPFFTGLGMTSPDITTLRSSFADLGGTSGLWAAAHGTYAPPGVNNFFFNAKNLTGVNYAG